MKKFLVVALSALLLLALFIPAVADSNPVLTTTVDKSSVQRGEEIAISDGAFYNCNATAINLDGKLVSLGEGSFQSSKVATFTVKEWAATTIPKFAFLGAKNLTSFTIPSSVTTIMQGAFDETGLTSLTFESPLDWTVVNNDGEAQTIALLNPTNNATYASSTYGNYTWKKAQ